MDDQSARNTSEQDRSAGNSEMNRVPEPDEFVVQEMDEVPAALVQYEML